MQRWTSEFKRGFITPQGSVNLDSLHLKKSKLLSVVDKLQSKEGNEAFPIVCLSLGNNAIKDGALDVIAYGVEECPTLKKLSLSFNCLSHIALEKLWERSVEHLEHLVLDGNVRIGDRGARVAGDALASGKIKLHSLSLSGIGLTNSGSDYLFRCISKCPECLRSINIAENDLDDGCCDAIVHSFAPSQISTVNLSHNSGITDKGAARLLYGCERCPSVKLVTLHGCEAEHESIMKLEDVFSMNPEERSRLAATRISGDVKIACCYGCSKGTTVNLKFQHETFECPLRIVECRFKCGIKHLVAEKEPDHALHCSQSPAVCPHADCDHACLLGELKAHADDCDFRVLRCPNECGNVLQGKLTQHLEFECPKRIVKCDYPGCKVETTADAIDAHELAAHRFKYANYTPDHRFREQVQKREAVNEHGLKIKAVMERLETICTESKEERVEREARELEEFEKKLREEREIKESKELSEREKFLSDAKRAVQFWRANVPRKCEFRCGERVLSEDYQYHITQLCQLRLVSCPLECGMKLRWKDAKMHVASECPERTICCNRPPCQGVFFKAKHQDSHTREYHTAVTIKKKVDSEVVIARWRALIITYRFAWLRVRRHRNESVFKEFSEPFQVLW